MERNKKDKDFVHQPEYPGGPKAMSQFIYSQLRYPPEALAAGVEGRVVVECDISDAGEVVATRVLKGLGYGCDEEAVRVVRLLRFRVKRTRGLRLLFHKKIHVQFKRPQPQPAPPPVQTMTIQYQIVPEAPTPGSSLPQTSTAYEYTISWTPPD
ncbi:MAG: energy transducer TonB [Saprospiraceae bacterium]|nr:energy transducer TonB [Saprospiraceae bacterium]MDW8230558.1 energy transducer TonB [Saprospiraceae bacterium]